ncbi:hypothetical protein [unidentified bacterial endosymbiont]|uniref:hypothetical protein n=1 Tax=unidentified bacterial endosymbiont TaxID=2355 RepID=UPI00209C965B|nr:hypothetical protein [unidentified bacterial endosymbiont]
MHKLLKLYCRIFLNKRLLMIFGFLSGLFALLSFASETFNYYFSYVLSVNLARSSLPILFLFISVVSFSFIYLQSGAKEAPERYDSPELEKTIRELALQRQFNTALIAELKRKVEVEQSNKGLSEEERKAIIEGAVAQTSEEAIKTIFEHQAHTLRENIKESLGFEKLVQSSKDIVMRLRREIADLRLRSNINLLIGMSITAGGLYLLWSTVSMVTTSDLLKQLACQECSNGKFLKNLILPVVPRVSLVLFIEVFAYFFLRLYRDGLSEIKYFQNELTNVESKLAAVEFSFITNNPEGLKLSIDALSKTERNFILEKGQTTVELEKAKSDTSLSRSIVRTLPAMFRKAGK